MAGILFQAAAVAFHQALFGFMRWTIESDWFEPFNRFRRDLGFARRSRPCIYRQIFKLLCIAMFSKALGRPQPVGFPTLQTGFAFMMKRRDRGCRRGA